MSIQDKFNRANVIYKITKDIDLGGETLAIPEGCTLDFQGGSFSNGTIEGKNTAIQAPITKIFGLDIELAGTWNASEAYPEWFGAKSEDDSAIISKAVSFSKTGKCKTVLVGEYNINKTINLSWYVNIEGNNSVINCNLESGNAFYCEGERIYINNCRLFGNSNCTAFNFYNVVDSHLKNVLIKEFSKGLVSSHSWCNQFDNIRFQGCGNPMMLNAQSNNFLFNKCSFVSFSNDISFINTEEIVLNGCEIANCSNYRFMTLYNAQINLIGCYFENLDTPNIVCQDASPSKINIVGGWSTNSDIYILYYNDNTSINVTGFSNHNVFVYSPYIKYLKGSISKIEKNSIPALVSQFDGKEIFSYPAYGGGSGYTEDMINENNKAITIKSQYTGFQVQGLEVDKIYTLAIKAKKHNTFNLTLRFGNSGGNYVNIPTQEENIEMRFFPFKAESSAMRFVVGQPESILELEYFGVFEGNVVDIKASNQYVMKTTPSIFKKGVPLFQTTLNKPIWWTGTKWVDANGTEV